MIGKRSLFLWLGAVLLAALGTNPVRADEKADALLKEVAQATQATKTLTADMSLSETVKKSDGKEQVIKMAAAIKLKKPNLARIDFPEGLPARTIASDGKNLYTLHGRNQYQQYRKAVVDPHGETINVQWAVPVRMFFGNPPVVAFGPKDTPETTYMGKRMLEGAEYDVVQLKSKGEFPYTMNLYIAPNKLVTRMDAAILRGTQTIRESAALTNVQVNMALSDASFAYVPPPGAILYTPPTLDDYNKKLLPVGSAAPRFTLSAPTGGKTTLADALKSKKAVLVNFWFYG